jgi:hypothetical protein
MVAGMEMNNSYYNNCMEYYLKNKGKTETAIKFCASVGEGNGFGYGDGTGGNDFGYGDGTGGNDFFGLIDGILCDGIHNKSAGVWFSDGDGLGGGDGSGSINNDNDRGGIIGAGRGDGEGHGDNVYCYSCYYCLHCSRVSYFV